MLLCSGLSHNRGWHLHTCSSFYLLLPLRCAIFIDDKQSIELECRSFVEYNDSFAVELAWLSGPFPLSAGSNICTLKLACPCIDQYS